MAWSFKSETHQIVDAPYALRMIYTALVVSSEAPLLPLLLQREITEVSQVPDLDAWARDVVRRLNSPQDGEENQQ